jgi:hypothetical protein
VTLITNNHSSLDNNPTTLVQSPSVHLGVSPHKRLEPKGHSLIQVGLNHTRANIVDNDFSRGRDTSQLLHKSVDHKLAILVSSETAEDGLVVVVIHDALASGNWDFLETVLVVGVGAHEGDAAGGVVFFGSLAEQGYQGEYDEEVGVAVDWFVVRSDFL